MAKKAAVTAETVQPDSPEVELVRLEGTTIQQWVNDARIFFRRATELELSAKAHLVRAEGLKVPTSGDQDAQLQDFIRLGNVGQKEIIGHWGICGVLDKLHKRAVQGRKRGTDAYEQAATIGNRLHNEYVDAEKRRARAEEDRIRRETEDRLRREREEELRQLEQQALKAEASSPDLSEREERFVGQMIAWAFGPSRCAQMAGYKDPDSASARLLGMAKIKKAIEAGRTALQARQQAAAVREAPVEVEHVIVRPDIQKGGDRTTWSAELLDERAFVQAVVGGSFGIPLDCLQVNQVKLNELARSLQVQIDRWPGVRAKKTVRVV